MALPVVECDLLWGQVGLQLWTRLADGAPGDHVDDGGGDVAVAATLGVAVVHAAAVGVVVAAAAAIAG